MRSLYRGVHVQVLRSFPLSASSLLTYDVVSHYLNNRHFEQPEVLPIMPLVQTEKKANETSKKTEKKEIAKPKTSLKGKAIATKSIWKRKRKNK